MDGLWGSDQAAGPRSAEDIACAAAAAWADGGYAVPDLAGTLG